MSGHAPENQTRVTVPKLRALKGERPIVMLTAYDVPSARAGDEAGAEILLVGDSVGMVVLGHDSTLTVTLEDILHHTRAVSRARPRALVVADMPYLSYHLDPFESARNAGRLVQEGGAAAVKVEGGRKRLPAIRAILDAEIPVMGHLGLTPQSLNALGGYKVQGKDLARAEELIADARLLDEAGIFSLVLEGVPSELAALITREVSVPTIGIGAGPQCDGQVLVFHDILGLYPGPQPKFVRRYADLHAEATRALSRFAEDVRSGEFPSRAESYRLPGSTARALRGRGVTRLREV
jgi:3-methyl-2-oxobutanoate hydroxymethyltransferase